MFILFRVAIIRGANEDTIYCKGKFVLGREVRGSEVKVPFLWRVRQPQKTGGSYDHFYYLILLFLLYHFIIIIIKNGITIIIMIVAEHNYYYYGCAL